MGCIHTGMSARPKAASVCKSGLAGGASGLVFCYFLFRGQNLHWIELRGHMVVQVQSCFSSLGIDKSTSPGLLWVTVPYGWWQVQAHPPLKKLILLSRHVLTGWATMPSWIGSSTTMKGLEICSTWIIDVWSILAVLLYLVVMICTTHGHSFSNLTHSLPCQQW